MNYTPAKETIAKYEETRSKGWLVRWVSVYNALAKAKEKSGLFGDSSTIDDPSARSQHRDYMRKVDRAVEELAADLTDLLWSPTDS